MCVDVYLSPSCCSSKMLRISSLAGLRAKKSPPTLTSRRTRILTRVTTFIYQYLTILTLASIHQYSGTVTCAYGSLYSVSLSSSSSREEISTITHMPLAPTGNSLKCFLLYSTKTLSSLLLYNQLYKRQI